MPETAVKKKTKRGHRSQEKHEKKVKQYFPGVYQFHYNGGADATEHAAHAANSAAAATAASSSAAGTVAASRDSAGVSDDAQYQ